MEKVEFILNDSDYTMADRLAEAINKDFNEELALAESASSVSIRVPEPYRGKFARLAARIGQLIDADTPARGH